MGLKFLADHCVAGPRAVPTFFLSSTFCFSSCTIRFHMVIVEETQMQMGREGALSQG
jgi:hypothetical protein